jgi:hypothetical protein
MFTDSSDFDESSSSSSSGSFFDGDFTFQLSSSLPTMWYNVPDGLERNPDIIRAEISLMTTPMSQAYATEAYSAVKNVQDVCAADYKSLCSTPSFDLSEVTNFLDNFMTPRMLTAQTRPISTGLKAINKVRSIYRTVDAKKAAVSGARVKTTPSLRGIARGLEGPRGPPPPPRGPPPPPPRDGGPAGPPPKEGGPPEGNRPPPRGPKPPPGPPPRPSDKQEDREREWNEKEPFKGDGESEEWLEEPAAVPMGPPPAPWEDVYFNGALGFGAQGDMCMYENFNQLSQPCVDSMTALYDVRQRFWIDTQDSMHGHGLFVLFLAGLVLIMGVKRCIMRKHIKKVRTFLKSINDNPALKATVEAETGMTVPNLPLQPCHQDDKNNKKSECCLKKFCKCFLTCVFVFIVSFFMAITSLEITSNIIANWDAQAAANGDEEGTPPQMALLVLMAVTLTEVTIFAIAVKAGKCLYKYFTGENCCDNNDCSTPSAPPSSPVQMVFVKTPTTTTTTTTNNNSSNTTSGTRRFWGQASTNLSRMFSSNSRAIHGDYTPLNSGDNEEMTEMVTVVPASSTLPHQYVVLTAAPVTNVNMV